MTGEPIGDRRRFDRLPGGGYAYELIDEPLRFEFRYLRRKDGLVHGEVDVQCHWAGVKTTHTRGSLSCAEQNISSQTARRTLAKYCAEVAKTKPADFNWFEAVDAACLEVIRAERTGAEVIVLDDAPDVTVRDHDVDGLLLPADAASFLVAPGDSLKSMITLYVLGTLAQRGLPALYLDWEWSADRHRQRKRRLFGPERLETLHYLRCRAPLTVEVDRIRRYCDAEAIAHIAIDSVGMAADGKLVDDDTARRFHQALALLPPALCGAHVAKSAIDADIKTDPHAFGSVYFENLCRMAWAVKKQPNAAAADDEVSVGLFKTKQNDGERAAPVGWTFTFTPDRITVQRTDLATIEGLSDRLPHWQRMAAALKRGPRTLVSLAEELGANVDTLDRTVRRKNGLFTRVSNSPDGVTRIALVERLNAG